MTTAERIKDIDRLIDFWNDEREKAAQRMIECNGHIVQYQELRRKIVNHNDMEQPQVLVEGKETE